MVFCNSIESKLVLEVVYFLTRFLTILMKELINIVRVIVMVILKHINSIYFTVAVKH